VTRRFVIILDTPIDIRRFKDADQDREFPVSVDFLKIDNLILGQLGNDDPSQLHLDWHSIRQQLRLNNEKTNEGNPSTLSV